MFVQLFKIGSHDPNRNSFVFLLEYYMSLLEIRDSFKQVIKHTRDVWKTCWNTKKKWLYSENLIDCLYQQNCYKSIGTYLSRETNANTHHQNNFIAK